MEVYSNPLQSLKDSAVHPDKFNIEFSPGQTSIPFDDPLTEEDKKYAIDQWRLGNYQVALQYFMRSYTDNMETGDWKQVAIDLNNIGLIQWRLNNCDAAMESYNESARLAEIADHQRLLGLTHTNRSLLYKSQADYENAFLHNNKAIEIFKRIDSSQDLIIAYNNQGQIYKNQGIFNTAEKFYLLSLKISEDLSDKEGMATACQNLSGIYSEQGKENAAMEFARRSLDLSLEVESKVRISEAFLNLSELHEKYQQSDSALFFFKAHKEYNDSLNELNRTEELAMYQARMGTEVKNLQILNLQNEQSLAKSRLWFMLTGIFIVALIVGFFIYRHLSKIKLKRRILENRLKTTRHVLQIKEQELKEYIIALSAKNALINQLQEEKTLRQPEIRYGHEVEVAELLEQKILTEEDWKLFKNKFSAIYPNFFARISLLGVSLTEAEIRFMVLFRLNLSARDMAGLLGISNQSVRVGKMRLKKKLMAEAYPSVEDFLQRLIE